MFTNIKRKTKQILLGLEDNIHPGRKRKVRNKSKQITNIVINKK